MAGGSPAELLRKRGLMDGDTPYLHAPGRLTAETITPGAMSTVPGEIRASSSSSSTLRAPSPRQGDTPAGQALSRELGFLTWTTMLWLTLSLSAATTESPVMYVMMGSSGIGVETARHACVVRTVARRDGAVHERENCVGLGDSTTNEQSSQRWVGRQEDYLAPYHTSPKLGGSVFFERGRNRVIDGALRGTCATHPNLASPVLRVFVLS